jgi:hypothetical protein
MLHENSVDNEGSFAEANYRTLNHSHAQKQDINQS